MNIENIHIFISYRRFDAKEYADALLTKLKLTEPSCSVFLDQAKMLSGGAFNLQIKDELDRADLMLLLISPYWNTKECIDRLNKTEDILHREISYALLHKVPILPILLEDAKLPSKEDLPEDIRVIRQIEVAHLSLENLNEDFVRLLSAMFSVLSTKKEIENAHLERLGELNDLMKSDPDKFQIEFQKEYERSKVYFPKFLAAKSIQGEGINKSLITIAGLWNCTAKLLSGDKLIFEFLIKDQSYPKFRGTITVKKHYGETINKTKIRGDWASVYDHDKDLFLGFFLSYIDESQNHEEFIIPIHHLVGDSFVGTNSEGAKFVSTNTHPRVEDF